MKKIIIIISLLFLPIIFINNVSASDVGSQLHDNANIFTTEQKREIEVVIDNIYSQHDIDVHFLTLEKSYIYEGDYADNYLRNLYNDIYFADAVVIVFSLQDYYNSQNRRLEIINYGYLPEEYLSMSARDNMISDFANSVGHRLESNINEQYFKASLNLVNDINNTIKRVKLINAILPHIIMLVIALAVAGVVSVTLVYSRGTKRTVSSYTYMDGSSAKLLGRYDRFVRKSVVRTPRQSSSSSGGGSRGGGGSRSSSGRSF